MDTFGRRLESMESEAQVRIIAKKKKKNYFVCRGWVYVNLWLVNIVVQLSTLTELLYFH